MEGANKKDSEEYYGVMLDGARVRELDAFGWECSGRLLVHEEDPTGMYPEDRNGKKRKWQEIGGKSMRKDDDQEKEQRKVPPKKILEGAKTYAEESMVVEHQPRLSAAAVLEFAAREAREGRRLTEFGAQAFAGVAYNTPYATVGEMGGSGSSSSSHVSPVWQVNDLDLDLPGELSMNEALLSLPTLAVFKQEAPSPTGGAASSPGHNRHWQRRHDDRQITRMAVDGEQRMDAMCQQLTGHPVPMSTSHAGSPESMQCQSTMGAGTLVTLTGYHSPPTAMDNKGGGLLICSPASSLDGLLSTPPAVPCPEPCFKDDMRFQYVLAAATSIATKTNEETLTYLNQGQPYEIKLKKLGDLSQYKGKILKSVIKICFHERRLQYMEREQMAQWHQERPGERIVEVDIPLSYGVTRVVQAPAPHLLNAVEVYWDPTKDVGVYVKVNCISTEFTAKKHGGEKGVPFRMQIETHLTNEKETRVHAAACQIKVFKLKGADRKHKQDREKVLRRPRSDLDKYQPGCEATVLTTLPNDALLPPPSLVTTTSPPYSPEMCMTPKAEGSPIGESKPMLSEPGLFTSSNQMKQLYCQDSGGSEVTKLGSPVCHSPGAILPDLPQATEEIDKSCGLSKEATAADTQAWLAAHRFAQHAPTFANFSGADLLRLSREDIIQICGLADGIRLFNALHAKRIEPRLTVYVSAAGAAVYSALYLSECHARELLHKLRALLPHSQQRTTQEYETVLVSGPRGVRVRLTDELVRHLPDKSTYRLERLDGDTILLSATD